MVEILLATYYYEKTSFCEGKKSPNVESGCRNCAKIFHPAKFGNKRTLLKSCNSAEWFKTQQICVR